MIDSALVDVNWLVEHLQDAELVILDASGTACCAGL
jgi:hypothetical protein